MMLGTKTTYRELTCSNCHVSYGLAEEYAADCERRGSSWNCPNGHGQVYRESELATIQKKLKTVQESKQYLEGQLSRAQTNVLMERRSKIAYKGQLTKTKNRIANGVCPCCNRTFVNLGRHMSGQHPDFTKDAAH